MLKEACNFVIESTQAIMTVIGFAGLPIFLVTFSINGLMGNNEISCLAFCIGVFILSSMVYTLYSLLFSHWKMCRKYNASVRSSQVLNDKYRDSSII